MVSHSLQRSLVCFTPLIDLQSYQSVHPLWGLQTNPQYSLSSLIPDCNPDYFTSRNKQYFIEPEYCTSLT